MFPNVFSRQFFVAIIVIFVKFKYIVDNFNIFHSEVDDNCNNILKYLL